MVSPDDSSSLTVKVMTFNIEQLYTGMGPKVWWDQANRAARIPDVIRSFCKTQEPLDVLILNECFNSYATDIKRELKDIFPFQTPVIGKSRKGWNSTSGSYCRSWYVINGGVTILSRHEIVDHRQYIYENKHPDTWDCWSNKGIAYVKVKVDGKHPVHILGTHLQADEGPVPPTETHKVRMGQLKEMRQFIVEELQLPKTDCVIMGGDFNVDHTNNEFCQDMETTLNTKIHYDYKYPGSLSPVHNWMARANARYYHESEEKDTTIDYLLVPIDYAQPKGESGKFSVVPLKASESWYWSYLAKQWPEHKGMYSDLSDHYPVLASFEFNTHKTIVPVRLY